MERGLTRAMVVVIVAAAVGALVGVDRATREGVRVWPCERARVVHAGRLLWGHGLEPRRVREEYRGPVVILGAADQVGGEVVVRRAERGRAVAVCCASWRVEGDAVVCDEVVR